MNYIIWEKGYKVQGAFLNVDLKTNAYGLRAFIDFSSAIYFIGMKYHMCEFCYAPKPYHTYPFMSAL